MISFQWLDINNHMKLSKIIETDTAEHERLVQIAMKHMLKGYAGHKRKPLTKADLEDSRKQREADEVARFAEHKKRMDTDPEYRRKHEEWTKSMVKARETRARSTHSGNWTGD